MKKQGPPEPLDEAHFTNLKRKAGLSVTESRSNSKKRRTSGGAVHEVTRNGTRGSDSSKGSRGKASNGKSIGNATQEGKKKPVTKSKSSTTHLEPESIPLPESNEDLGDDSDAADLLNDEFDDLEDGGLGDDFLDSGSDVYDSDQDHPKAMFSEDEDETDAEEKLTAANIAGLTRKLDDRLAEEAADAQAELEDDAMRTNIAGDRPKILEDEDEEDIGIKSKALLAPDLQLLRTRINDTVRVLDEFAKLAEEGRSRAEYTAQLIKDVCAYYGYSEYLAEKLFNLFPPEKHLLSSKQMRPRDLS